MIREYRFPQLEKVIFGVGAVARVPQELDRLGKERAFILTGKTLATKTDLVRTLETLLEDRWVGTYSGCRQHVPSQTVTEAVARAREAQADVLISFGGGSPIDTAKLVALELLGDRQQEALPQIAISTTLSAGEFTPFAGITDEKTRVKSVRGDPRIMPKIVVLDPEVTLATPLQLWAATGIKALDHAIEALWSVNPQPVTDVLAMEAIRTLYRFLPLSVQEPHNLEARHQCQIAAWMSIFGLANVGVRLSHIFGHQIGARWDVPHGITSCITLPHCMRFLAPQTLERQVCIAHALGIPTAGRKPEEVAAEAAQTVEAFIASFGVPQRLREVGAKEEELPAVAQAVIEESTLWHRQQGAEEALLGLLRQMW
ncbi:MAG: iron-containing alcohol dehydrogenase [Candidatus Binatia bacterium]|nr:iron-containing alcohol dehydrogenase [Candidatus Binatia bacterium]